MDSHPVPERAQLLEAFGVLQPARSPGDEIGKETHAIGVDADVATIGHALRQAVAIAGEGVASPGQGRTTESQGQAVDVGGDLDHVRIEQRGDLMDRLGQGSDGGLRVRRQVGRHLVDERRGDQRLVALDVDHDGIAGQAEPGSDFLQAIGAGVVLGTCQQRLGAEPLARRQDAFVVGGDDHAAGGALAGLVPDALDHWLAGDILQWLAGQTSGGVAGGNDDSERLGHYLSSRSSTFRERASLSSITGMPSRIG